MSTPVILSIRAKQNYFGQKPDTIELMTEGTLDYRDGGWDLCYEESELTGLAGVDTTFRVEPDKISLIRTGRLQSQMIFQEGLSHESLYQTEHGALMMNIRASRVFYDIVPDGGTIDLVYHIGIENTEAGIVDYHLDIRKKNSTIS